MTNSIHTAVLDQYNTATHSIIKEFVLAEGLTELERLARIAVMHAVMDYDGENEFTYYVSKLFSILLGREVKQSDSKAAIAAVAAVHKLRVSNLTIVDNCQLNEFGMSLIHSIAEAVALITPERYLPMHNCTEAPSTPDFITMNIEGTATVKTNLVKNGLRITRKRAPVFFQAMDKLWTQQYTLNEDIMNLTNLETTFSLRQFALGASPAFADTFSFRFTCDHRGRVYARSMYAQPQGDSFSKAVLNLGTKKAVGFSGLKALAIHYANVSGHDKLSLEDRIKWSKGVGMVKADYMQACDNNWAKIELLSEQSNLDKAFEEYAAAMDFYRAVTSANPVAYESNLVCHQDATNSGFQFGAALLGDAVAAKASNLLSSHYSEAPEDLYKEVAETAKTCIATDDDRVTWEHLLTRTTVKKLVMVSGYGAQTKSQLEAFKFMLSYAGHDDMICHSEDIQYALTESLETHAGSLLQLTSAMKSHASSTTEEITWITEDGFLVKHAYTEELSYGSGKYKIIDRSHKDCDEKKLASALPPNFIHSIDGNMLRKAAIKAHSNNLAFVPIHDSFGTHAADFFELGRTLRESFIEVMSYEWYEGFCITNSFKPVLSSRNEFDLTEVRKSTYMFS